MVPYARGGTKQERFMQHAHGPVNTPHWRSVRALANVLSAFRIWGSTMNDQPELPIRQPPPPRTPPRTKVIVLLLHPPEAAAVAAELATVWRPAIPAADVLTVSIVEDGGAGLRDLPLRLLDLSDPCARPLVLAGICGAEAAALRLGFDRTLPQCIGILVGGRILPPLGPLAAGMADRSVRLRLLWEVSDSMAWAAALGELLSWFRAAGLDAQGTVLERAASVPMDERAAACSFSPALVRMGRVYLAELVAVAMNLQPRPTFSQPPGADAGSSPGVTSAQTPSEHGERL
jgi:hypothetical protein